MYTFSNMHYRLTRYTYCNIQYPCILSQYDLSYILCIICIIDCLGGTPETSSYIHWENSIFISFQIEWNMIVVTDFLSNLNQMEFYLVQNRKENSHHNHIPFNVKGNENRVFSVYENAVQHVQMLALCSNASHMFKYFLKFIIQICILSSIFYDSYWPEKKIFCVIL